MKLALQFALLSAVVAALVNPGNFGTIDTVIRLQVARWLWAGESPVREGGGFPAKEGKFAPGYGVGQSLLLIPFNAAAQAAFSVIPQRLGLSEQKKRLGIEALTAFLMQTVLTASALMLGYQLLLLFGFTSYVAIAGVLSLLLGSTCLQYVQCAQENLLLLTLSLLSLTAIRRSQTGSDRLWYLAGAACGFAILVRLTSVMESTVIGLYALSVGCGWKRFLPRFLSPILIALFIDRSYHWYWFGEVFSTYAGVAARHMKAMGAPASFPFSAPFWGGFWGTLFSPEKSVLLFDPLLLILLAITTYKWRAIGLEVRRFILYLVLLYILYSCFYAKFEFFGGDVAWGHRYVTLPVHLLCLLAVPILLTHGRALEAPVRWIAWTIVLSSIVLQCTSTIISPQMEVQQKSLGYGRAVIWNRAINLVQLADGNQENGRIRGIPIEWRSLNYLPFQLRFRYPSVARWAIPVWIAMLVALPFLVWSVLMNALRKPLYLGRADARDEVHLGDTHADHLQSDC